MMMPIHYAVLQMVADRRTDRATGRVRRFDLRRASEAMRQAIIDLAMREPPLVDINANDVFATEAGHAELRRRLDAVRV